MYMSPDEINPVEYRNDINRLTIEWLGLVYQYILDNPGDTQSTNMDAVLEQLLSE